MSANKNKTYIIDVCPTPNGVSPQMRFLISSQSGTGFTEVTTEHNGRSLTWVVKFYTKVQLTDPSEVFMGINQYLETLPDEVLDAIFEIYVEMKEILEETYEGSEMVIPLQTCIKQLYSMVPMESIRKWIIFNYPVYIPEIPDTLTDRYMNRDETYIKADYFDLVVFSLATRFMIPVWGEYITRGGAGNGGELYKELDALSLVSGTEMMKWPLDNGTPGSLPARDKLMRYIEIKAERNTTSLADLFGGMSCFDIPARLLATVILRRLTIVPLTPQGSDGEGKNIVANLHHYVDQRLRPNDKRAGSVNPKMKDSEGADPDDKTSVAEQYKIRQKVSDGDIMAFQVEAQRQLLLATKVDPSFDPVILDKVNEYRHEFDNIHLSNHQLTLAQWALAKAYPPRAFEDVDMKAINNLVATAQALYWHWGLYDIAILMTVEKVRFSDEDSPGLSPLAKPTSRFKNEILEDFMQAFPHFFPQSGKDAKDVKGNVAFIGVSTVLQEMFEASWYYRGNPELYALSSQNPDSRTIIVQTTIRQTLHAAVMKIVSLNQ
tara:strand:+ start:3658 stop:5298 length:1641 start_codon:yes stop_codon:yes gene_type:complete